MDELLTYVVRYRSQFTSMKEDRIDCHDVGTRDGYLVLTRKFPGGDGISEPTFYRRVVASYPSSRVDSVKLVPFGFDKTVNEEKPKRAIDGKFSTDGVDIFNTVSGEKIPADEPLFLLRGRDTLAWNAINQYWMLAANAKCNDLHMAGIDQVAKKFARFATDHHDRMKQPGITKHLKLETEIDPSAKLGTCKNHLHDTGHLESPGCIEWSQWAPDQKPTSGLWRYNPETREGKYLVKRRDGTVPEWPWFVLGAKDPAAPDALTAYANSAERLGFDPQYVKDVRVMTDTFYRYMNEHGKGDPDRGRHRVDDPKTVEEMRGGHSA